MASTQTTRRVLLGTAGALAALPAAAQRAGQQRQPQRAAPPPQPQGSPALTPLGPIDTLARHALIVDFATGATLLEKDADVPMPPASMSKLMTAYVVFELLRDGRLRLDQELPVSERAWRMGGSKMFVEVNTTVKVEDLLRGVIVQSGNDACIVLAEAISGSEEQFSELLNERGRAIGLTNSTFRNSTGWPHPQHRMSCRDLALLAARLIHDFPDYYRYYAERSFRFNNITQENRNPLLYRNVGADGLKTGHTEESGFGLTASAVQDGRRVILVVNGLPSMRARSEESERLMRWAFTEFENVRLFGAAETVEEVPVHLGTRATVPLVAGRDLVVTVPRQWRRSAQIAVRYVSPVKAPVLRGAELGRLEMSGQGVPSMSIPLYAGTDVPMLGFLPRILGGVRTLVLGS
ncbi:D-alanyl-D-alanine carboxypeptidase family protein [Elioraea tepidiphila]|jgi:D-alanyl-D-alanine carboxypeptidase (penicillin-binding protein 5/6)|uniref:D-alanyl-D-alanine carboxypeptidase family protein n=1 Tax=Elioraea tepidiphila TaxID=457934 RepID=UPI00035D0AD3|nr:D-alanyl-D-alanine carboxypeptidase family protein [Elioraea tepidiphila]